MVCTVIKGQVYDGTKVIVKGKTLEINAIEGKKLIASGVLSEVKKGGKVKDE